MSSFIAIGYVSLSLSLSDLDHKLYKDFVTTEVPIFEMFFALIEM